MSHPMPGAGLARSEPRPSQYVFPNNKLSFINKPLPTTASSNKYCVKCAISARKCCWVRSRESANGRAKNFPKQPYLSAIPLKGFKRLANAITRDAIGIPLTRKQQGENKAQRPKLDTKEIDKNAYRTPIIRQRTPREMRNRRKPGWTTCDFCLPAVSLEGLRFLANAMAEKQHQERTFAPRGHRRRYPRTRNFYVLEALN